MHNLLVYADRKGDGAVPCLADALAHQLHRTCLGRAHFNSLAGDNVYGRRQLACAGNYRRETQL